MSVAAWGATAAQRRRSRVELWRCSGQLCYGLVEPQPAAGKMAAVCATSQEGVTRWLGDGALADVLTRLARHPRIDASSLERFFSGSIMQSFRSPARMSDSQGYGGLTIAAGSTTGPCVGDQPIRHGLAMRM